MMYDLTQEQKDRLTAIKTRLAELKPLIMAKKTEYAEISNAVSKVKRAMERIWIDQKLLTQEQSDELLTLVETHYLNGEGFVDLLMVITSGDPSKAIETKARALQAEGHALADEQITILKTLLEDPPPE